MRQYSYGERLKLTAELGTALGILSIAAFAAGSLGYVNSLPLNIIFAAGTALVAFIFIISFLRQLVGLSGDERILLAVIFGVSLPTIALCFLPPTSRDELIHHLTIPALYIKAGEIIEVPFARYSYYPMLADMLYMPWLSIGFETGAKLVHALFGFLTAYVIFNYLTYRIDRRCGLLGALIFLSTPIVFRLLNLAYVDLALTFYGTCALFCLFKWQEEEGGPIFLWLAGLCASFAGASKPNGGLIAGLLVLSIVLLNLKKDRTRALKALFIFGALSLVAVVPWLIRNYSWTGNPFFPFFRGIFESSNVASHTLEPASAVGALGKRLHLYGESILEVILLPARVFFFGEDDSPRYFDGRLNPIFVFFLPFAFTRKFFEERVILFVVATAYFLSGILLIDARARYLLPSIPFLTVLAVLGIHRLSVSPRYKIPVIVGVVGLLSLNFLYIVQTARKSLALEYLSARLSRETYLKYALPEYATIEMLNQATVPSDKVYLVFMARKGYYLKANFWHDDGELPMLLLRVIENSNSVGEVGEALKKEGITHLLIRGDLTDRFLRDNLSPEKVNLYGRFITEGTSIAVVDSRFSTHKIK